MITPVARVEHPGTEKINIAKTFGTLLKDQFAKDPHFYLFSPDETTSNRLATVYDTQSRAWSLPVKDFDLPSAPDGHIVELLSENTLFATLLGLVEEPPGVDAVLDPLHLLQIGRAHV